MPANSLKRYPGKSGTLYARYVKRAIDAVVSACGLAVLSPLFLVLIVAIGTTSESVFFKQRRYGRNKVVFKMIKFETLTSETPAEITTEALGSEDIHFTSYGAFLRKYSLNELPQLANILKGEMSIVGPRPAMMAEQELLKMRDNNGANVLRPGLTGWAQINGRDELSESEKAAFDGEYLQKLSFATDLKCFFLTFSRVVSAEGVAEETDEASPDHAEST